MRRGPLTRTKGALLLFVEERRAVRSDDVADELGYTLPGAASMLLRLHRHGHLRRQREGRAYVYTLAPKGEAYLRFRALR